MYMEHHSQYSHFCSSGLNICYHFVVVVVVVVIL